MTGVCNLARCLNPDSILVVGGGEAERVIEQSRKFGFTGSIEVVNPKRESIAGIRCLPSVSEIETVPDAGFIAIPAEPSIDIIHWLAERGAGGAICYASGFNEVGAGDRQQKLVSAAGQMPVIGPNCYGFVNALNGAVMWPDQQGLSRVDSGVAIFSGSGNLCINMSMHQRSVPVALLVSVGNQAMIGIEQCVQAALEDDRITAIGIHIEGLTNLPLFIALAEQAADQGKPIVALKTGRSEMGAKITLSHTATLAGEAGLYDALFERLGVAQVDNLEAFLETLKLLSVSGPLTGNRLISMSCSGGEASLIADLSQTMNLEFPSFDESHRQQIQQTLNEYVCVDNPFDYHTFIWGDVERMRDTFTRTLQTDVDLALLLLDYPGVQGCDRSDWDLAGDAFIDACRANDRKGAVVCSLAESMPEDVRKHLIQSGITPLMGMKQALAAIESATGVCKTCPPFPAIQLMESADQNQQRYSLSEFQAKQLLSEYGLNTPQSETHESAAALVSAAERIGFPVVLKICDAGIAHKSEFDGIALNLKSPEQVHDQSQRLLRISQQVLVEQMITDPIAELLLGVSYDPQFGHYLILGFGGVLVELIADRQVLLMPASDDQIKAAINKLKISTLLHGYRGKPAANIDTIVEAVQAVCRMVDDCRQEILEIDINPLIVGPEMSIAADALIVMRGKNDD